MPGEPLREAQRWILLGVIEENVHTVSIITDNTGLIKMKRVIFRAAGEI